MMKYTVNHDKTIAENFEIIQEIIDSQIVNGNYVPENHPCFRGRVDQETILKFITVYFKELDLGITKYSDVFKCWPKIDNDKYITIQFKIRNKRIIKIEVSENAGIPVKDIFSKKIAENEVKKLQKISEEIEYLKKYSEMLSELGISHEKFKALRINFGRHLPDFYEESISEVFPEMLI